MEYTSTLLHTKKYYNITILQIYGYKGILIADSDIFHTTFRWTKRNLIKEYILSYGKL